MKRIIYNRYRPGKSREKTLRRKMIEKHGHRCMSCGFPGYLEMHHKKRVVDGGDHVEENVLILCEKCHAEEHGRKKKNYLDKRRLSWKPN